LTVFTPVPTTLFFTFVIHTFLAIIVTIQV